MRGTAGQGEALVWVILCATSILFACQSEAEVQPSEEPPAQELEQVTITAENALVEFTRLRLLEALSEGLPAALEAKESFNARRLCDAAQMRMQTVEAYASLEGLGELDEQLDAICARTVTRLLLDELIEQIGNSDGTSRQRRCETSAIAIGYVFDNWREEAELLEKRSKVFEMCPVLKDQWEMVEQRKSEHQGPTP